MGNVVYNTICVSRLYNKCAQKNNDIFHHFNSMRGLTKYLSRIKTAHTLRVHEDVLGVDLLSAVKKYKISEIRSHNGISFAGDNYIILDKTFPTVPNPQNIKYIFITGTEMADFIFNLGTQYKIDLLIISENSYHRFMGAKLPRGIKKYKVLN